MTEKTFGKLLKMEDYSVSRMILIVLSVLVYIATMVVNSLAGAGKGEYPTVLSDATSRVG